MKDLLKLDIYNANNGYRSFIYMYCANVEIIIYRLNGKFYFPVYMCTMNEF